MTIGDFWGIAKSHPNFFSSKGVSSVFINTQKGVELFEKIKDMAAIETATIEEGLVKQGNLVRPSVRPEARDHIYDHINDEGFISSMKIKAKPKEMVKALLPTGVVNWLKKM